jgi:cytochrome oxidase Cu insertion factor (SCO1/SenC/PrrC family)
MRLRTVSRVVTVVAVAAVVALAIYATTIPKQTQSDTPQWSRGATTLHVRAPNFHLNDQFGKPVSIRNLRGKYVILTFFYAHCTDTCPLTSQKIRSDLDRMGSEAKRFRVVIVSTDPVGDSPGSVKSFLRKHGEPGWQWALGSYPHLQKVWSKYHIYAPNPQQEMALGDEHTAVIYLINRTGIEDVVLGDSTPAGALEQDLHLLAHDSKWKSPPIAPNIGSTAPKFSLKGLSSMVTFGHSPRPTVINFWATYCGPCKQEMPMLEHAWLKHRGQINFIGVDEEEPSSEVAAFVKELHVTYPIGLDTDGNLSFRYEIEGSPTTFFVDSSGVIRATKIGQLTRVDLRKDLSTILS